MQIITKNKKSGNILLGLMDFDQRTIVDAKGLRKGLSDWILATPISLLVEKGLHMCRTGWHTDW